MVKILTLFLLCFLSCSNGFEKKPNQDQAVAVVWHDIYNMDINPPSIEWININDLNCDNMMGFTAEYTENNTTVSGCVAGLSYIDTYLSEIAWSKGANFDSVAFAHELAHQYLYLTTGNADPGHTDLFVWGPGGLVNRANEALFNKGL